MPSSHNLTPLADNHAYHIPLEDTDTVTLPQYHIHLASARLSQDPCKLVNGHSHNSVRPNLDKDCFVKKICAEGVLAQSPFGMKSPPFRFQNTGPLMFAAHVAGP